MEFGSYLLGNLMFEFSTKVRDKMCASKIISLLKTKVKIS